MSPSKRPSKSELKNSLTKNSQKNEDDKCDENIVIKNIQKSENSKCNDINVTKSIQKSDDCKVDECIITKNVQKNENGLENEASTESPADNASEKTDETMELVEDKTLTEDKPPIETSNQIERPNVTPSNHRFKAGERVLCFHGPLIYEAKCHNVRTNDLGLSEYFIHYNGWNKTWDEWVPECRVLKFNDSNVQRQKDLKKSQQESDQSAKKKKKTDGKDSEGRCVTPTLDKICKIKAMGGVPRAPSVASSQDSGSDVPRKKKARLDNSVETMEEYLNKVEIKIKIPDSLRTWLVDDWDTINNKNKLHQIPAKTCVDDILESYLKHKASSKQMSGARGKAATEMVAGLKEYFNVMLGSQLLYQAERRQYSQLMQRHQGAALSSLYGASHLLRLFVRIGSVLAYTALSERNIQLLQNAFQDFLWYLLQQATTLNHCSHYIDIPSDLIQRCATPN